MISLGGIIGAGLFVGSSATINAMGPAACLSYLMAGIVVLFVMRMLGEMALAHPGVGSFYVGSLFVIACIVPWASIKVGYSPFVAALETMHIPGAADIMNAIVLVAVLSALNSGLYVSSRIVFRLAERRDAPRALLTLSKSRVPRLAVLASSIVGYVAIVAAIVSPQGVFLYLVSASGAVMLFVYLSIAVSQIVIRRRLEATEPERLTFKMWLFPWLSWAVVAAIAGVLCAMGFDHALSGQLMASLASLAVVSAAYVLTRKRTHAQDFREPATNWKK
ncbi:hypothetical protein M3I54_04475 [Paraburkholderia sp. CNPSo 3274]|nr:hypothetical protein [Paraburkholderia sp. CNPSo 3274]MCP3706243.1 hypothetical protein [Paraburkholderia sp. CNPSo 3274]